MKNDQDFSKALEELSQALAYCDDPRLIEKFLHSILTESEISDIPSRWALVRLIDKGVSQRQISQNLGLSLCKITRGSKMLKEINSPFKKVIEIYKKHEMI